MILRAKPKNKEHKAWAQDDDFRLFLNRCRLTKKILQRNWLTIQGTQLAVTSYSSTLSFQLQPTHVCFSTFNTWIGYQQYTTCKKDSSAIACLLNARKSFSGATRIAKAKGWHAAVGGTIGIFKASIGSRNHFKRIPHANIGWTVGIVSSAIVFELSRRHGRGGTHGGRRWNLNRCTGRSLFTILGCRVLVANALWFK